MKHITNAIIPAAGLGTRFLPFTKSVPKELAPILNKPALHYILDEGIDSGIRSFCIVSNDTKQAISHYLSPDPALETALEEKGKRDWIADVDRLITKAQYTFVNQDAPRGLGHAVWCARDQISGDYFGLFLPDDLLFGTPAGLAQLITAGQKHQADAVIALAHVPKEQISAYGVVEIGEQLDENSYTIKSVVEKPSADEAPSDLAIVGRYVLPTSIFPILEKTAPSASGEIQLTDAFTVLIGQNKRVIGHVVKSDRFDTGTPLGWLQANIYCGLQDPHYGEQLRAFLQKHIIAI